jgi:hypothetical protein
MLRMQIAAVGEHDLPVGDPVRSVVGRALLAVTLVGLVFCAFSWTARQLPALYRYEPWQDDPYDAMVSFAMWSVPLLLGLCALRLPLCRRYQPLPVRRVLDLLRVSRVLLGVVVVVLVGDWVSVALGAHSDTWNATTAGLIVALVMMTALAAVAAVALRRARGEPLWRSAPAQPDWLADTIALGEREVHRLGRWRQPARILLRRLDLELVARVRRRPLPSAAAFSIAFGAAFDAPQIILERYTPALALLFITISACSVFAFVVIAGAYLHVVGRPAEPPRPIVLAAVVASAAVPLAASFRGSLWWLLGTNDGDAGVTQLAVLVLLAALVSGAGALAAARLMPARRVQNR